MRPLIASGTHALAICLFGLLRKGGALLSISGQPYDTLHAVIGIDGQGQGQGSLAEWGCLRPGRACGGAVSTGGASLRNSHRRCGWWPSSAPEVTASPAHPQPRPSAIAHFVHQLRPDVVVMVDNCYSGFTRLAEPVELGGGRHRRSLIKNPRRPGPYRRLHRRQGRKLIERISYRMTSPGLGRGWAPTPQGISLLPGPVHGPHVVLQSLKGAALFAKVFKTQGYRTLPGAEETRNDIIQSIIFGKREGLIAFCQGIQKGSPVDAMAVPEAWHMPGYQHQVIMAAGAFVQGASIELSADAPMREPFAAYLQGGLCYDQCFLAAAMALDAVMRA